MGTLFGLAGMLTAHFYALQDYWRPTYLLGSFLNIEDFFYGFFFGGIACELAEDLLKYKDVRSKKPKHRLALLLAGGVISLLSLYFLTDVLKLNSIIAYIVPPMLIGFIVLTLRRDLSKIILLSGFLTAGLAILWFSAIQLLWGDVFSLYWRLGNLSGHYFLNIPLEEIIFAFALGFGGSCFYETVVGYREAR